MLLAAIDITAQTDNNECAVNYSMYKEFQNVESYTDAREYYVKVFENCPEFGKNIYSDGVKLYKALIERTKDEKLKEAYADTIAMIYFQRIKYFGDEANQKGRLAMDIIKYKKNDSAYIQSYQLLKESLALDPDNFSLAFASQFFAVSIYLNEKKHISAKELYDNLVPVSMNINKKIANETDPEYKNNVNKVFASIKQSLKTKIKDSLNILASKNSVIGMSDNDIQITGKTLDDLEISDNDFYIALAEMMYQKNPDYESAYKIAEYNKKNQNWNKAEEFFSKALQYNITSEQQAVIYYELATIMNYKNLYGEAISYAKKSASLNRASGSAYLLTGAIYAANAQKLGKDNFEKSCYYWLACDYFNKAKYAQQDLKENADALISKYSPFFPKKEDAFMHSVREGDYVDLNGYESERTRARF